jgi:hypothetical protein
MSLRRHERGEGRFGTLVGVCVLGISIYLGVKVIPVMVNVYAFRDFLEEQARFAALAKRDEDVKNRVLAKARELDLPIGAKNVQVARSQTHFDINVKYVVPIETPIYTYNWSLAEAVRAPLF